jgi:hypothetical protein
VQSLSLAPPSDAIRGWVLYSCFAFRAFPQSLPVLSSFWSSSFHLVPGPIFPNDIFPCALQLLRSGSSSCCRWSISSWIHNLPGAFPLASGGAPQPDSGPYAASSVLQLASLQLLPWGTS